MLCFAITQSERKSTEQSNMRKLCRSSYLSCTRFFW